MTPYKFDVGNKVVCLVGGKYQNVPENAPGVVNDRYISPESDECVYEVVFGGHYVLVREADLK